MPNGQVNRKPPIVTSGLVLHLDANNIRSYPGSGNTWFNLIGLTNNFTLSNFNFNSNVNTGGLTSYNSLITGALGSRIDSINGSATINTNAFQLTGDISFDFWFKVTTPATNDLIGPTVNGCRTQHFLISTSGNGYGFTISIQQSGAVTAAWYSTSSTARGISGYTLPIDGLWHHLAFIKSGSTPTLYVDGVSRGTPGGTGTSTIFYNLSRTSIGGNYGCGGFNFGGGNSGNSISIVRMYNRALSAAEVLQNYSADAIRFGQSNSRVYNINRKNTLILNGLVLNLDANNIRSYPGSGTSWNDISGNGNNGTLINGPTFSSNVNNGGSIVFDGTNDYIGGTGIDNARTSINGASATTTTLWIKRNTISTAQQVFLYFSTSSGSAIFYFAFNTTNTLLAAGRSANEVASTRITTATFTSTNWLHVAIVMNYSSNTITIYVNGVAQATTGTVSFSQTTLASGTVAGLNRIGIEDSGLFPFNGSIAQVLLYNRALSAAEVLQNYSADAMRFGQANSNIKEVQRQTI